MSRLFVAALLFLIGSSLLAQDADRGLKEAESSLKNLTSPRWLLYQEAQERPTYRSLWNGGGNWIGARLLFRAGGETELGLSEEQSARLAFLRKDNEIGKELMQRKFQEQDPALMQAEAASRAAISKDDPYFENSSEEQKRAFVAANEAFFRIFDDTLEEEVADTLSPEQMQKVQMLKLQLLPEMGLAVPSMFEPLGLSEEQRAEMEAIRQEMEPEFEALLDESMSVKKEYLKLMTDELAAANKEQPFASSDEVFKAMRPAGEKASKNENLIRKQREVAEKGKKFATRIKENLMNVLTDEQLDRMQRILDETPEFAKKMLAGMRQQREAAEKSGQWSPGPGSWRPGDGMPDEFKKQRQQGRFPKQK